MRGYSASIPWLAELEETLDKKGQYEDFKAYFEEETGMDWQTERESIFYHFDETVTALAKAMDSSEESAVLFCLLSESALESMLNKTTSLG